MELLLLRYENRSAPFLVSTSPPAADLKHLQDALRRWFADNARVMPWRQTRDPYRVWVSEVMLQQTRVEQATPYFERFVGAFPTVEALASADLGHVLRLWEGLGYYARARHLHAAARQVVERYDGRIPRDEASFRSLPGVGAYTVAAVMSIAHNHPLAAVDGNVIRVLSRLFGVEDDVSTTAGRHRVTALAESLLDRSEPGRHNEALMELGATVCLPAAPACDACPFGRGCAARKAGTQMRYPVRARREPVAHFDVAVGLVYRGDRELLIQRRAEDGLLGGLWEFPGGKREPGESLEATCSRELREELGIEVEIQEMVRSLRHAYTHFRITLHAFRCRVVSGEPASRTGLPIRWASIDGLGDYAFPRANRRLIEHLTARSD